MHVVTVLYGYITRDVFFFFNDTATTEIYTLSLHDALPILNFPVAEKVCPASFAGVASGCHGSSPQIPRGPRSEEHTSELQSLAYLVCRLLLEKKNTKTIFRLLPTTMTDTLPSQHAHIL